MRVKETAITLMLTAIMFSQTTSFADKLDDSRYACIPVATSFALKYFDIPHKYEDIYSEIRVQKETGHAPLEDLLDVCSKNGLECRAFRGLTTKEIKSYLGKGYIVAVCVHNSKMQHIVSMVGANDRIIAIDLIKPLHYVNEAKFKAWLKDDTVCVIIGKEMIKYSKIHWKAWLSLAIFIVTLILMLKGKELRWLKKSS